MAASVRSCLARPIGSLRVDSRASNQLLERSFSGIVASQLAPSPDPPLSSPLGQRDTYDFAFALKTSIGRNDGMLPGVCNRTSLSHPSIDG